MVLTKLIRQRAGTLAAASLMAAACLPAHAQSLPDTISNVAQAEWTAGGQTLIRPSNSVEIAVKRGSGQGAKLELYRFAGANGTETTNLAPTMCQGTNGPVPVALHGVFADLPTNPAVLARTTSIRAGEPLVLKITAPNKNINPGSIDSFNADVRADDGDVERLTFTETAPNSAIFMAMINTSAIPPASVAGDCVLSVRPGAQLSLELDDVQSGNVIDQGQVDILVDPFGLTFDSADGAPVDGTQVTIVDAATGAPAQVFGDDGASAFPSTIITGGTVTDSGGQTYVFEPGFYRFPFLRRGDYRLIVSPVAPYTHPSVATPAEISVLTRPDGGRFVIAPGSYGGIITLNDPAPVRIDIPLDRPGDSLQLRKSTSATTAMPGDVVQYRIEIRNPDRTRTSGPVTVTDLLPDSMRLRVNSLRYNGTPIAPVASADGKQFSVTLPPLPGGGTGLLTYLTEVRIDARPGDAVNRASARDNRGTSSEIADASVRIIRDGISERFTIVGRITDGGCGINPRQAKGISGVRVMLQDGTYTITDVDGRYHFEGVIPGLHVVQVDPSTFPLDRAPINCAKNSRSAGSAISRFVEGRGGSLKRADFRAHAVAPRASSVRQIARPVEQNAEQRSIAGGEKDWVAGQVPGTEFLFPGVGHNPPVPAIRVAFKHARNERIELSLNGKPVDPLNFDGIKRGAEGLVNVSTWRGVELEAGTNKLVARVLDANGAETGKFEREVHFATPAIQAQFIKEKSLLLADGVNRPRIAVRLTDRTGKPIQPDAVGAFSVSDPYRPAVEIDAQQANQLSGLERAAPVWRVIGEDGIAYIELEPTTASGTVAISFDFLDGQVKHSQRIETWLDPGDRPWTVVGFAAGTIGFNKLEQGLEDLAGDEDPLNVDGRIALYAKGRVSGKWLMTLAYDSDKKADDARFAGTIDPRRYYTVYADRSEQRYDAASIRRLYLKLERPQFYALFGDYQTGIDEPELARYQRSFNGIKAEYRSDDVHAQVFAADTPYRYRRDEIQGTGLSGPYALSARDIFANSERITLETRDRLQSNIIVERKQLMRHIDYDIDYASGTLRFREPILSRSSGLDPQFIIAEYEVDGVGERVNNAGGRVKWQSADQNLQIAATAIHDETDSDKTNLVGADIRYRPAAGTELRAEFAATDGQARARSATPDAGGASALLLEAEHHGPKFDLLGYYRRQSAGFGVGQTNRSELGAEKFGLDTRYRLTDKLSISALGYQENYLDNNARRIAGTAEVEYRNADASLRAGLTHANDRLDDGTTNQSTLARIAGSYQLTQKLEVSAQTEFAIGGQDESVDFPARHSVGARYAIRNDIALIGSYEIAKGEKVDAKTARIGFDIAPWSGGRILASANQQDIGEFGARTFASYGLAQSFRINDKWSLDFTLDGNQTVGGFDRSDVINPLQPVASGGFLGSDGTLSEDFVAVTGGATYRGDDWSWTGRAEWRDGDTTQRYGFNTAILREIGEGRAVGSTFNWFKAQQQGGAQTMTADAEISWAHRPADSQWALLNKTEFRHDAVKNAVAGLPGPVGGAPLLVSGDVKSDRVINSLSVNYTPIDQRDGNFIERGEYALFWGTRYTSERFGEDDVKGWSNVIGADLRFDLSDIADIGASGTVRVGTSGKTVAWSGGPTLTVTPFENANVTIGYNFVGFKDRDFEESRYTRSGPFLTFKLKFDQTSLAGFKF